jgi:phage recombination protein Bet
MGEQSISVVEGSLSSLSREQIDLLKRTACQGATDDELAFFLNVAASRQLDPFLGQIHAVKRYDSSQKRNVMACQVGIDGFRLIADRTGQRDGESDTLWCGKDGKWQEVWTSDDPPFACKVTVWRKDSTRPYSSIAYYKMYVQRTREGKPNSIWTKGAAHMMAKSAESGALRKAFPAELSGLYTDSEMQQAGPRITEDAEVIARFESELAAADSLQSLNEIAVRIKALSAGARGHLRDAYRERMNVLAELELSDSQADESQALPEATP